MVIKEFNEKIVLVRRILGLSLTQMSELLNVSRQALSSIESSSDSKDIDMGVILRFKYFLEQLSSDDRFNNLLPTQKFAIKELQNLIDKNTHIKIDSILGK